MTHETNRNAYAEKTPCEVWTMLFSDTSPAELWETWKRSFETEEAAALVFARNLPDCNQEEIGTIASRIAEHIRFTLTGSGRPVKTLAGWKESGVSLSRYLHPGDPIDEPLFENRLNSMWPAFWTNSLMQTAEPIADVAGLPTYTTFAKRGRHWIYVGECHLGQSEPPAAELSR